MSDRETVAPRESYDGALTGILEAAPLGTEIAVWALGFAFAFLFATTTSMASVALMAFLFLNTFHIMLASAMIPKVWRVRPCWLPIEDLKSSLLRASLVTCGAALPAVIVMASRGRVGAGVTLMLLLTCWCVATGSLFFARLESWVRSLLAYRTARSQTDRTLQTSLKELNNRLDLLAEQTAAINGISDRVRELIENAPGRDFGSGILPFSGAAGGASSIELNLEEEELCDGGEGAELLATYRRERSRDNGEREWIIGSAKAEFEEGADFAFLNIAFCPPFHSVPNFDYEQTSGGAVDVRVGLTQPFGVRLEIRKKTNMSSEDAEKEVWFDYCASCSAAAERAVAG